jgi:hypothetical protein
LAIFVKTLTLKESFPGQTERYIFDILVCPPVLVRQMKIQLLMFGAFFGAVTFWRNDTQHNGDCQLMCFSREALLKGKAQYCWPPR